MEPLTETILAQAEAGVARTFEAGVRRLRAGSRFPPARRSSSCSAGIRRGAAMVTTTLEGMAAGGMYDLVGGGFHRYSVDDRWLVPHFEKMLYDNALLASAYLHAWAVTGEEHRRVVDQTLDYVGRELRLHEGGLLGAGRRHRRRSRG